MKGSIAEIVRLLCSDRKQFMRICFIGTDRKSKKLLRCTFSGRNGFSVAFINDTEKAKEWLINSDR